MVGWDVLHYLFYKHCTTTKLIEVQNSFLISTDKGLFCQIKNYTDYAVSYCPYLTCTVCKHIGYVVILLLLFGILFLTFFLLCNFIDTFTYNKMCLSRIKLRVLRLYVSHYIAWVLTTILVGPPVWLSLISGLKSVCILK